MIFAASSAVISGEAVIGSGVIHSRTRASLVCTRPAIAFRRSRSVTIPISRPKSFTTAEPVFTLTICSATSPSVSSGATVMKLRRMTSAICVTAGSLPGS